MLDINQLVTLLLAHKYVGAAALVIGLLVAMTKGTTPLPFVPARARPVLALLLGSAYAAIDSIAHGTPAGTAIVTALVAGLGPVAAHEMIVESLFNGKELFSKASKGSEGSKPPDGSEASKVSTKDETTGDHS